MYILTHFLCSKTQLQLFPGKYKGPLNCVASIYRDTGVWGFYRGLSALVIGSIPKAGVRFGAFNFFKKQLADDKGKLSTMNNMLAGLGAGVCEGWGRKLSITI